MYRVRASSFAWFATCVGSTFIELVDVELSLVAAVLDDGVVYVVRDVIELVTSFALELTDEVVYLVGSELGPGLVLEMVNGAPSDFDGLAFEPNGNGQVVEVARLDIVPDVSRAVGIPALELVGMVTELDDWANELEEVKDRRASVPPSAVPIRSS